MADIPEIAKRLNAFIQAAKKKEDTKPVQSKFRPQMRPSKDKDEILKIYEECLGALSDDQCAELDRILGKMSGVLKDVSRNP